MDQAGGCGSALPRRASCVRLAQTGRRWNSHTVGTDHGNATPVSCRSGRRWCWIGPECLPREKNPEGRPTASVQKAALLLSQDQGYLSLRSVDSTKSPYGWQGSAFAERTRGSQLIAEPAASPAAIKRRVMFEQLMPTISADEAVRKQVTRGYLQ